MIQTIILGSFLIWFSIADICKRQLPLVGLLVCGGIGVLLKLQIGGCSWKLSFAGMAIGCVLVVYGAIADQKIGFGDGILLMVTGLYLGIWKNLLLLFLGTLFLGIIGGIMIMKKKGSRNTALPFVPFLTIAYFLLLF